MQDDDYEKGKIVGKTSQLANEAVQLVHNVCSATMGTMEETPVKISFLAGVAMVPMAMVAMSMAGKMGGRSRNTFSPTIDEITFGAYYVICAVEEHPDGIIAGFSPETVDRALRLFRERHGRDYTELHPVLVKILDTWRAEEQKKAQDIPDAVKQFLPEPEEARK